MTMTDPVSDLLTRIRNGLTVRRKSVDVPSSALKSRIALVMKEEGWIRDVEAVQDARGFAALRIHLKYRDDGRPALSTIRRVSKPGCRVYSSAREIPQVRRGLGTTILSTPKGVLSDRRARELGVGGEVLCTLY